MKKETELAVRTILGREKDVDAGTIEQVIGVLDGTADIPVESVTVLSFEDARSVLKVDRRELDRLLDEGELERVYGSGDRSVGVTRSSVLRFMERWAAQNRT